LEKRNEFREFSGQLAREFVNLFTYTLEALTQVTVQPERVV